MASTADDEDDDFDLDGALEASLAQMEMNNDYPSEQKAEDSAVMQDALNAVQQSINDADAQSNADMMNDDEMKEFFNEIFKSFSNLDDDGDDESLDKALKKIMTQFFDSTQLKEPVAIIVNKYPEWLRANQSKITAEEYENYKAQYELYQEANRLLSASKPDTSKIMDILLKTFSYGSLPPEVMDGMMPDELKQFADQMAMFEKDIESTQTANSSGDGDGNGNGNGGDRDEAANSEESGTGGGNEDMNAEEAMKFFQQLIGMQKQTEDDQKDGDFTPNLNDLPKLNEEEMRQFREMMNQDGCSIQ